MLRTLRILGCPFAGLLLCVGCGSSANDVFSDNAGGSTAKGGAAGAAGTNAGGSNLGGSAGHNGGSAGEGGTSSGGSSGQGGSSQGGSSGEGGSPGQGGAGGGAGGNAGQGGNPACPLVHDEDGDGLDDSCDNCPSYENAPQVNGDGDAVGDACERPSQAPMLSKIPYFDPFLALPNGWELGGMFSAGTDELLAAADNCGTTCQDNSLWNTPLDGAYSVETSFTFEDGSYGYVGVLFSHKPAGGTSSWWGCLMNRPGQNQTRYLGIWNYPGSGTTINKLAEVANPEDPSRDNTVVRRIRVYVDGNGVQCTFETNMGDKAQVSNGAADYNGRTGLRVYSAYAHFRNFVVYKP
jgi:hypothetical protein